MSIKQFHVCDGCGGILTGKAYYLNLKTDSFWDGTDMDYLQEHFEFCWECAQDIKKTLEKIATNKDKEIQELKNAIEEVINEIDTIEIYEDTGISDKLYKKLMMLIGKQ